MADKTPKATKEEPKQKRGKGFPVIALDEAAKAVKQAAKYGMLYSASAFAGYLGHSTTNSGVFLAKRSAINDFGLIKVADGQVILTDLGKRVALPRTAEDERAALRDAFMRCTVFSSLYEATAKGEVLSVAQLANAAVHDLGVSARTKDVFATSLVRSAVAAGLAEKPAEDSVRFIAPSFLPTKEEPASVNPQADIEDDDRGPSETRRQHDVRRGQADVVVEQRWPLNDGEIVLVVRRSRRLPAATFTKIGEVIGTLDELASALGYEEDSVAPDKDMEPV